MSTILGQCEGVENKGPALMFRVFKDGQIFPAFAIRYGGKLKSYLNVCPHMGLRLNRESNSLFHREQNYLFCHARGAGFDPDTGSCVIGPCPDHGLVSLNIEEVDGSILYPDQDYEYYA